MQRYPQNLSETDRRIARKWRLASLAIYGTFLAGFVLYGALGQRPAPTTLASSAPVALASSAKFWPGERSR
jgi:hypothetical protein